MVRSGGGTAHHWSARSTTGAVRPSSDDAGQAEQEGGDPGRALHPRGARRQQRRVLAMLQEPPARAGLVADRPLDQRVAHGACGGQQFARPAPGPGSPGRRRAARRRRPRCRSSDRRCPRTRGAAVAAHRRSRTECRHRRRSSVTSSPATSATPACASAANRCEVPAGPVAPGVRHRLHLPRGGRDGVRDDEPAVVQRAHGEQVLRALARLHRRSRGARSASPGNGQRGGDAGRAVRVVRRPGRAHPAASPSPARPRSGPRHAADIPRR